MCKLKTWGILLVRLKRELFPRRSPMATTTSRGLSVKRQDGDVADEARQVVRDRFEELARAGARQMLVAAWEDEVIAFL